MQIDRNPTIENFFRAFGARWFLYMCGPATVPFAFLAVFATTISQQLLWASLAVACAVFTSYWIWRTERLARNAAEDKAAGTDENRHALDESASRLGHLREAIMEHARQAPILNGYDSEIGSAWESAAIAMLRDSVEESSWSSFKSPHNPNYAELLSSVASFRAVGSNLKSADLRRK